MKRSWTRVMGREVVKALEYSWWAPGVGKVADLSRFYDDGDEQTWMLWLLKAHGNSDNPHSLLKYLRKMSKKEVRNTSYSPPSLMHNWPRTKRQKRRRRHHRKRFPGSWG
ncbi:MAG TPA: hypothetical protein EYN06_02280 [Myxococcales bacterium]|nr:hypothetical protein [Myxococcales bacterium]